MQDYQLKSSKKNSEGIRSKIYQLDLIQIQNLRAFNIIFGEIVIIILQRESERIMKFIHNKRTDIKTALRDFS